MKGKPVEVWRYYKIEGGKLVRLKRECPRCGRGVFLAEHKDRLYCGKCGHTMWLSRSRRR